MTRRYMMYFIYDKKNLIIQESRRGRVPRSRASLESFRDPVCPSRADSADSMGWEGWACPREAHSFRFQYTNTSTKKATFDLECHRQLVLNLLTWESTPFDHFDFLEIPQHFFNSFSFWWLNSFASNTPYFIWLRRKGKSYDCFLLSDPVGDWISLLTSQPLLTSLNSYKEW